MFCVFVVNVMCVCVLFVFGKCYPFVVVVVCVFGSSVRCVFVFYVCLSGCV